MSDLVEHARTMRPAHARRIAKMRRQHQRTLAVAEELAARRQRAAFVARMAELDAHPERATGFEGIGLFFHRWALRADPSYAATFGEVRADV